MKKNIIIRYSALMCAAVLMTGLTACQSSKTASSAAAETETAAETTAADESSAETESAEETERTDEAITVEPLTPHIAVDGSMVSAQFPASFTTDDFTKDGDTYVLSYTGYVKEVYDNQELKNLREGDSIVIDGETILIDKIENSNGYYLINGGIDEGGYNLMDLGDDTYSVQGYDDIATYKELGTGKLPISADCIITDYSQDINTPQQLTIEELVNDKSSVGFNQYNTLITISDEGGEIAEITRNYLP